MINGVQQVGVPVKDIERSSNFYNKVLNIPLLFKTDKMAFLDCGNLKLMLALPEKKEFDHQSSVIYFEVDDINSVYKDLKNENVEMIGEPHIIFKDGDVETWMTFFKDTEDNTLAFTSNISTVLS